MPSRTSPTASQLRLDLARRRLEARRCSPAGELVDQVRFPVSNITKIAFGGPDLKTAYATTARQKMTPEQIARQSEIGDLFAFEVEVAGVACPRVRV